MSENIQVSTTRIQRNLEDVAIELTQLYIRLQKSSNNTVHDIRELYGRFYENVAYIQSWYNIQFSPVPVQRNLEDVAVELTQFYFNTQSFNSWTELDILDAYSKFYVTAANSHEDKGKAREEIVNILIEKSR